MFFDDVDLMPRKRAALHALPEIPETGWSPPTSFPNLSRAAQIALDVETKETDFKKGPGWARGKGHIVGVSLAAIDKLGNRGKWYFPVRHEVEPQYNLDPAQVFPWLKSVLETQVPKVGANLLYDIGWLCEENIFVGGPLEDIQFAEALIDEYAFVALDVLGRKYLRQQKTTNLMYEWLRAAYPNTPKTETRGDIYRCSPRLVGAYAEDDADIPLRVLPHQKAEMARQGLLTVFNLECRIIPLLIRMRREGVSVDLKRAAEIHHQLTGETSELYDKIEYEYGYRIEKSSSGHVAGLLKHIGVQTPLTADGNPSVTKDWLADLEHPVAKMVNDIREREKLCGTFIESYIIDKNVNGRIFPQFHPLKGDVNGTMVGRFASSDPNLQNIPGRTKLGKLVRQCFIPDNGHLWWCKADYSQIHYRILAHFAVGPGSDDLRQSYIDNPEMDYHQNVLNAVAPLMGWDVEDEENNDFVRRPIKNVNFGLLYGQSQGSLAAKTAGYFGSAFTEAQVKGFFDAYFEGAPYVKPTMEAIAQEVQMNGFVTSVLGRRCRFHMWESSIRGSRSQALPHSEAVRQYGSFIKRAFDYRGVNYKFQSSEPDLMKSGMLQCMDSGVFDYTGVPRVTVHDELGFSVHDDKPATKEAYAFIQHTMAHAVPLRVPVFVDMTYGDNWGQAK